MTLRFRNIDVTPDDPVESWGFEGLLAAVDRGDLGDWRRILAAVRRDPYGDTAQSLEEVFTAAEDSGVVAALRTAVAFERERQDGADRESVAAELRELVDRSGLDQGRFARGIGTSRTRLNTYLTGRTMPSALVLVRARRLADRARTA